MAKQLIQYTVTFEIEDDGQFDQYAMRDGIIEGIILAQDNGNLTLLEDESTVIHGFNVQHTASVPSYETR